MVTYSTTEPATPPSRPLFLGTTNFLLIKQCLNNTTQLLFKRKADLILPFKPILLANLRAYDALQQLSTLHTRGSLIDSTESLHALKLNQIARSSQQLKSRRLSDISSTLIREDSRPGYARWQIWLINC
jgi:hypothetical protein